MIMPADLSMAIDRDNVSPVLDSNAFEREFLKIHRDLKSRALYLARNHHLAEDLVQEAAIRGWNKRDSYNVSTNFKAWMYRILRNCFFSHARHVGVAKTDTYGDDFPDIAVSSAQESVVSLAEVERYWKLLPPSQQRALQLVSIHGHSYEDAARIEGIALGTVKSRATRARKALHSMLDNGPSAPPSKDSEDGETIIPMLKADMDGSTSVQDIDSAQIAILREWRINRAKK